MKKKNYKQLLDASFEQATPELRADVREAPIVITSSDKTTAPARRPHRNYMRHVMAACLALVLILSVTVVVLFRNPGGGDTPVDPVADYRSYITLSINPSFSLTVDDSGIVTNVVAENYDGEVVLDSITEEKVNLTQQYDVTLRLLLRYAQALGYVSSSNGIQIDIYNYNKDNKIKEEMRAHIESALSVVDTGAVPVQVSDLARETILGIARDIYNEISDEIDEDDLFHIIGGKKGYGDRRPQGGAHEGSEHIFDHTLFETTLVYYATASMDLLHETLAEAREYMTEQALTAEEFFSTGGMYARFLQQRTELLLTWMGDTRTLTAETFEILLAASEVSLTEDEIEELEEYVEDCRDEDEDDVAALTAFCQRLLAEDANVAAVYERMKTLYGGDEISLKIVTALERSWRQCVQMFETLDKMHGGLKPGGHGDFFGGRDDRDHDDD